MRKDHDWRSVEARLGTQLPLDYKKLVETFGLGEFSGYMGVLVPDVVNPRLDLLASAELEGRENGDTDATRLYPPFDVYPQSGGLLCWSFCGYGQSFLWKTDSADPEKWPVVVYADDDTKWFEFEGGAAELLYRVFTEEITVDVIPEIGGDEGAQIWEPIFRPISESDRNFR
nr:SMI1/KNR4 family protein [Streptomyces sp. SID3343]